MPSVLQIDDAVAVGQVTLCPGKLIYGLARMHEAQRLIRHPDGGVTSLRPSLENDRRDLLDQAIGGLKGSEEGPGRSCVSDERI